MNRFLIIAVIFSVQKPTTPKQEEVTANVMDRIAVLKQQIADEIQASRQLYKQQQKPYQRQRDQIDTEESYTDNYEYLDTETRPVTPINENDERKQKGKYRLKILKTTTSTTTTTPITTMNQEELRTQRKIKRSKALQPKEIFYRKVFDDKYLNKDLHWTHCQDLITPFLTGQKKDITLTKRVMPRDNVVSRLIHLLSINMTGQTSDDIYSVMYQISNLQVRLFQWDVTAIKLLLNVIVKGQVNFTTLKRGLKNIFNTWHLDIGNITNLLKQARIFRPPCIPISENDGSTKPPKSQSVYTISTTKKPCSKDRYDDDEENVKKPLKTFYY